MRILIIAATAALLAGCAADPGGGVASASSLPAAGALLDAAGFQIERPILEATPLDDQALVYAYESFDAVLYLVDAGIATGVIKKGTPRGDRIKAGLIATKSALRAASSAQRAGSVQSYQAAFAQAQAAIAGVTAALKGDP